jgi:hypothetical protein
MGLNSAAHGSKGMKKQVFHIDVPNTMLLQHREELGIVRLILYQMD